VNITASQNVVLTVSLCALLFLVGCATQYQAYEGQKLPSDKVAVVKGNLNVLPGGSSVSISSVDGKPLSPYQQSVEILPGTHVLGVQYRLNLAGGLVADGRIAIDSQAGKRYQIDSKKDGDLVTFSVVEEPLK